MYYIDATNARLNEINWIFDGFLLFFFERRTKPFIKLYIFCYIGHRLEHGRGLRVSVRMSIDLRMPQLEQIHFTINTNVSNPHFLGDTVKKRGVGRSSVTSL